ncbi:MAG: VCBS repeat-containing protein, partial [Bacteroidetes bacterium]|nr:VCBS repeat-containing protein [Bacteroidota bacterium]
MKSFALLLAGMLLIMVNAFGQTETCNDGVDNNGDGKIDCADIQCTFAPTIEKGCNCYDGKDNDGNGKIDAADPSCAGYYGMTFVGQGTNCSINPPPGTAFSTIAPPQTSSQNTADTPAKIAVGDMNHDGVPDVVVTSKWNSTIQVVSTTTNGTWKPGDIMGDFRTPGSKIFPKAGSNYVFEHEVAIADINKDGIGEMFAIASERGGSPNNKPVRFFLTGFQYAVKNLNPLWNAVDLGPDRPGSIGVADFDGDGKAEVYLRNQIYAAESGKKLADGGGTWDTQINSAPVAVNILGDSKLELVCGNFIYGVPSLAGRALVALSVLKDMNTIGAIKFFPKGFNDVNEYGVDQASSTSTADFDGDGFIDVFMTGAINCSGNEAVPCGNNITTIFYWNVQKNTISTYAPPDPTYPATGWSWGTGRINLGDANGDGKMEALFLAGSQLFCLAADATGNLTQLWVRTINDPFSGILALTVYDFDNDGKPEVVYRDTQELVITDGQTGQVKKWSAPCSSHTWTEGPVVADVNGDGNTDICVPCYTNGAITTNTAQQQSLGQTRLYYSSTNAWIPTRQVWNQHGYFVTNINDNLTLPFPQLDPSLIFSNAPCPSGLPGPQRPFNLFMNQVPHLSASGCPEFPAPDLTYFGDDPANPGVDSNGDGTYSPAVVVTPPVCGNLDIKVNFNIINNGDLPISDVVPVSFFNGDPTVSPVTAVKLFNTTLNIVNLGIGQKLVTPTITFNGPGTAFKLYIVLYNDGSSLPISLTGQSTKECTISNNIYSVQITPTPFTATIEKVSDNIKCLNSAPDTGQLKAHVFKGGVEQIDLSPYKFQWYTGAGTGSPIAAPGGTNYLITGLAEGTYTLVVSQLVTDPVTKVTYNCASTPVQATLVRIGEDPTINISVISHQTVCSPPNGQLQADLAGLTPPYAGYTFAWYDVALNNLGISGNVATNLVAGNYVVQVKTPSGCVKLSNPATVNGPQIPDANASTLQNVVDCSNPNSGSVTANALFNGVVQNPANYTFDWYFYNNATSTRGSILPPANGTGQTRTGLAVGYYQVVVTDNTSKCVAGVSPITQVQSQTVIPTAQITQLAPQTSCDPLNPNGILQGDAVIGGVVQNPASFTFQWFKGNNTLPANLVATTSGTNGQVVNKVAGGGIPYTVKVTTALNCSATTNFIITETLQQPVVTLTPTPNSICNPALASSTYNGTATATVTFGGVGVAPGDPNYTYAWHQGSLSTDPTPSPNSTTNVLSQQNGGNYTLVVTRTDLSCMSNPVTTTITNTTVLPVLTTSAVPSTNCVAGKENGTAQVVTVDGAAVGTVNNYTYQWYTGAGTGSPITVGTNPTATSAALTKVQGGAANNYTVQVTNSNSGCQNTTTVNVPDGKVLPILSLTPTSNGICNPALTVPAVTYSGTVTAAVTNQIGPLTDYTFSFGGGMNVGVATANVYSQLNGGATPYTATTTHTPTGCVSSVASATVTNVQAIPVLTTGSIPSTNCVAGKEDGKAQVLTVDGTPVASAIGYTYSWAGSVAPAFPVNVATNNSNTATLIKVQGGAGYNYAGTVTNQANGCQTTASVNVADGKQIPVITLAATNNGICNPALTSPAKTYSGKITATITNQIGVLSDYTFAFGAGMGPGVATANVYDQLNGGATPYTAQTTHTITGCTSAIVSAAVSNVQSIPVLTTGATSSTNCVPGKEDGVAQVLTVDGTAVGAAVGYTYNWVGPVAPAFPVSSGANNSNTFTLIKVQGGAGYNYTITVTNQFNGCQGTTAVNVPDGRQQPLLTLTPTNNGICNPALTVPAVAFSGKITGAVTNQVGPITDYTFLFGGGMGAGVTTGNVYDQLNGGPTAYTATVTNNITGCQSAQVTAVVANVQAFPVLTTSTTPSTNCVPGKEDGVAQVLTVDGTAVGSASGYAYSWAGPVAFPVNAGTNNSNTPTLIKVQGGAGYDYAGTVTNQSNGCQTTVSLNVTDGKQAPLLSLATTDNGICTPALTSPAKTYSGKITASVTNQVGLLSDYVFTFGAGMSAGVTTGNVYDQLNGGATPYTAIVTHTVTGCVSAQSTAVINNVQSLPVLTTGATASTNCAPGLENGLAQVVTVDGTAVGIATGYTYAWTGPVVPVFPVNAGTNNSNTATLIKVQGGAGYDYAVTVTNQGNGCQTINSVNVPDSKAQPTFTLTPQPNTVCDKTIAISGAFDGQVQADVNAAGNYATSVNGDFNYNWSIGTNGTGVNLITGLDVGTYTLTATHVATGCQSVLYSSQVLDSKVLPTISTASVGSTNCAGGVANGSASVTAVLPGGKNYDYQWYNGNSTSAPPGPSTLNTTLTTDTYSNVQGGLNGASLIQYTVQVTILQSGCVNTATIGVSDDSQLPVLGPLTSTDNTFCVGSNGTAATTTLSYRGSAQTSPFPGFVLNWSNGDTGIATTTPLPAGNYTVTATKTGDNCTSNPVSVTINDNLFNPVINMTETPQSSCDTANPNGQLFATVDETSIGGAASVTAGYTFTWKNRGNPYGSANTSPNFVAPNGINQLAGNIYYEVTVVRSSTGCSNIQSHELTESIIVPTVSLGGLAPQTNCNTPDGSVTATVGTPPVTSTYTYFWLREQAGQTTNDPNTVITTVQGNLGAGFYNKINTVASNVNTLGGTVNGRYTVVVQDDYNKCVSQPVSADIADNTQSIITISIGALPSSCAAFGALTMNAVRVSAPPSSLFDFQVFRGGPVNAVLPVDYYSNPPNPPAF